MKIIHTPNPMRCYIEMTDEDKEIFKAKLYKMWIEDYEETEEDALKWTEHQYPYYISALTSSETHCGDCIKVPCSCTKCEAEYIYGVYMTPEVSNYREIDGAFANGRTLEEAILHLQIPIIATEDWHVDYLSVWNARREAALQSLIEYKETYFP